jgi:hypothetical protein
VGEVAEPPPTHAHACGPPRRTPGGQLALRPRKYRDAVLRFAP